MRRVQLHPESLAGHGHEFGWRYRYLGFTAASVATFLQVSVRSVQRWERTDEVPVIILRHLRLLCRDELHGPGWEGWSFNRGKLWSPEGHGFSGHESKMWSQTLRAARAFSKVYAENGQHRAELARLRRALAGSPVAVADLAKDRTAAANVANYEGVRRVR